jgi:predicted dehydrogenase
MSRVRLGAVGAGWWATSNHFPIFAGRADVELVGVCGKGPSLETVRQQFGFQMATEDYAELLDQDLDAIVITTPHDLHYDNAVAAIERGLHVQVEKPTTLDARAAWDLVERVERNDVHFLVPYGWNYKDFSVHAQRLLADGLIGQIQHVLCHMASPTRGLFAGDPADITQLWESETGSTPDVSTWQSPRRGGGYAHGQITHSSALLFFLTGLRAATVAGRVSLGGAGVDLFDAGVMTFAGGAIGALSGAASGSSAAKACSCSTPSASGCGCTAMTASARSSRSSRERGATNASHRRIGSSTSSPARARTTIPTPVSPPDPSS